MAEGVVDIPHPATKRPLWQYGLLVGGGIGAVVLVIRSVRGQPSGGAAGAADTASQNVNNVLGSAAVMLGSMQEAMLNLKGQISDLGKGVTDAAQKQSENEAAQAKLVTDALAELKTTMPTLDTIVGTIGEMLQHGQTRTAQLLLLKSILDNLHYWSVGAAARARILQMPMIQHLLASLHATDPLQLFKDVAVEGALPMDSSADAGNGAG